MSVQSFENLVNYMAKKKGSDSDQSDKADKKKKREKKKAEK